MPGNIVKINNRDDLEWYIGDSKMEELIGTLNRLGVKTNDQNPKRSQLKIGDKVRVKDFEDAVKRNLNTELNDLYESWGTDAVPAKENGRR